MTCRYCDAPLCGRNKFVCQAEGCRRKDAVDRALQAKQKRLEEIEGKQPGTMVRCAVSGCGMLARQIHVKHLRAAHNMSLDEYVRQHPDSPLHGAVSRTCQFCLSPAKYLSAVICSSEECGRKYARLKRKESEHRLRLIPYQNPAVERVECLLCREPFQEVAGQHLIKIHNITTEEYLRTFPGAALATDSSRQRHSEARQSWMIYLDYGGNPPDDVLLQALTAGLLGDGDLEASGNYARYCEIGKNKSYMAAKLEFYTRYFPCDDFEEKTSGVHKKTGKRYHGWPLRTKMHPLLRDCEQIWYTRDRIKVLPRETVEKYLTPFALSIWYCDDGNACRTWNAAKIHTQAFQEDEVQFLSDLLESRYGIVTTLNKDRGKPTLRLGPDARVRLLEVIQEFQWAGMEYKFAPLPRGRMVIHGDTPERRREYWLEYNREYMRAKRKKNREARNTTE